MKKILPFILFPLVFLIVAYSSRPNTSLSVSPLLYDRNHHLLSVNLTTQDKWRLPLESSQIPPQFIKMLVAFEDKRFFIHPGFDPIALARASWQWIKNGQVISGGSTLTMQTVRLLNPRPRTVWCKLIEIVQAVGLELTCSKAEILRLYLSIAPYGGNIEGLRTASWVYFSQEPNTLTPSQLALLAVIPQHPNRFNPLTHPELAKAARNKLLARLALHNLITPDHLAESISDPLPIRRHRFPNHAPHVMVLLKQRHPGATRLNSTLDIRLQKQLESLMLQTSKAMERHQTAAALIIDNKTREIRAYVGSADPYNEEKQGHVDILRAIRSPGSALKPFIYGLAFEEEIIHPDMIMKDVITSFHGYNPTNFRDIFHGDVSVRESLQQSLNIPVIYLLDHLGPGRFVDWLAHVGVKLSFAKEAESIGLPVALGGVGIRFTELVSLYVALADKGMYQPLKLETAEMAETPFLKPESCRQVTDILQGAPLPEGFADWISTGQPAIAFKTGTSYGARDAVCVGYSSDHTVGVWTGRADGTPCPNQMGRTTAAPVVLHIFKAFLPTPRYGGSRPQEISTPGILKRFKTHTLQNLFKITTPLSNSLHLIKRRPAGTYRPLPIALAGGTEPYTCWINGKPLHLTLSDGGKALWTPPGTGFYNLTIVDGEGKTATCTVQLVEDK